MFIDVIYLFWLIYAKLHSCEVMTERGRRRRKREIDNMTEIGEEARLGEEEIEGRAGRERESEGRLAA